MAVAKVKMSRPACECVIVLALTICYFTRTKKEEIFATDDWLMANHQSEG